MNVLVNSDNDLHGIFFQDEGMKQAFAAYPELLCVDATYKLLELRLPLYIMLAEVAMGKVRMSVLFCCLKRQKLPFRRLLVSSKNRIRLGNLYVS